MDDDISLIIRRCKRGNLTKLDLSKKNIGVLPQEIYQLTNLEVLDLQNNKIVSLDLKISNLSKLKFLDLSSNQLITLPSTLLQITNLQVLNVSNNPLSPQFMTLTRKENQSIPKLMLSLKACFANSQNIPPSTVLTNAKSEGPLLSNLNFGNKIDRSVNMQAISKPDWLEINKNEELTIGYIFLFSFLRFIT